MRILIWGYGLLFFVSCVTEIPPSSSTESVESIDSVDPAPLDFTAHPFLSSSLSVELAEFADLVSQLSESEDSFEIAEQYVELVLILGYISVGDFDEARTHLDVKIAGDATHLDARYLRALLAEQDGDLETAEAQLRVVLELEEQPRIYAALGEVLLQKQEYELARQAFEDSLAIEENYIALRGLGALFIQTERYIEAESTLDKAIALAPDNSFLYSDRGLARILQNALNPALADFNRAIELNPHFAWNYLDRGRIYMELRKFPQALADYDTFLMHEPEVFIAYVYRAQAYDMLDELDAAAADYQKALELREDYYPAYAAYAVASYLLGDYERAAYWFEKGYREEGYYEYLLLTAISHEWVGRSEVAKRFLEEEITNIPVNDPFYLLASLYLGRERDSKVRGIISTLKKEVDRVKATVYLAIYYDQQEVAEQARTLYQDAIQMDERGVFEIRIARYHLLAHN